MPTLVLIAVGYCICMLFGSLGRFMTTKKLLPVLAKMPGDQLSLLLKNFIAKRKVFLIVFGCSLITAGILTLLAIYDERTPHWTPILAGLFVPPIALEALYYQMMIIKIRNLMHASAVPL